MDGKKIMLVKRILFLVLVFLTAANATDETFVKNDQVELIDPTNNGRRNLRSLKTINDVRYLVLGYTVPTVDGRRRLDLSYTSLLTSDPSKMARLDTITSGGPAYPFACLQTVISDLVPANDSQEFDVIILEYNTLQLKGLYELAARLRQRYPDAILILLDNWQPNHISWFQDGVRVGNIHDWAESQSITFGSREFRNRIKDPTLDFRWQEAPKRELVLKRVEADFGAILRWIPPLTKANPPVDTLLNYDRYFDGYEKESLSAYGHNWLYNTIQVTVESQLSTYPAQPTMFDWGVGDECHTWYLSGKTSLQHAAVVGMERFTTPFQDHYFYALSAGTRHPNNGGYVIVNNPFDIRRNLFISYMGSGSQVAMYRKTEIKVENYYETTTTILNPVSDEFGEYAHVILTSKVAVIPPGISRVYWTPLEDGDRPFRLTATMVVSTSVDEAGNLGPRADFTTDY